ncbi:hypothetical protein F5887DRAFT_272659 [Amanita rubescens]|nr:hypothetical protein F5887DRAFT_272659 [Amanita rubescens]
MSEASASITSRLSDNIIQEIFIWYINDDPVVDVPFLHLEEEKCGYPLASAYWDNLFCSDSPNDSSFELPLPFVISRVCSTWRRVALATPLLWNSVCIATFDLSSKRLAAEWLLKAGSSPVSITIHDLASDPDFNIYDELEEFLSDYHIKSLELPLLSETCSKLSVFLHKLPEEKIVQLESLSLVDLEFGQQEVLLLDNARYPCLRELQLIGRFVADMIVLPWKSLRRLDAATALLPMMQCLHILRDSVSLEVCYLGISSDTESGSTVGDLNLPALHELTLSFNFEANVGDFIRRLTTPSLKILNIERAGFYDENPLCWSDLEYSRMMERSNRPLYHLAVGRSTEVDVYSILQSGPMLVEVSLHRGAFRQETLDDLATGQLAPLLQHFCVDEIIGVPDSAFSEMIQRRTENSAALIGSAEHRLMPFSSVMALGSSRMNANFGIVYPPRQAIAFFHNETISERCCCASCITSRTQ